MGLFEDLTNKYKGLLSNAGNTLSSFVQQNPTPMGFLSKQIQPQIQQIKNITPQPIKNYVNQVKVNAQTPFFNNQGNNPIQWAGKVIQDVKKRGPYEGLQDLTYPVLMNPAIEPLSEPITAAARVANYKAGRPFDLINKLLGQTDKQMAPGGIPRKDWKNYVGDFLKNNPSLMNLPAPSQLTGSKNKISLGEYLIGIVPPKTMKEFPQFLSKVLSQGIDTGMSAMMANPQMMGSQELVKPTLKGLAGAVGFGAGQNAIQQFAQTGKINPKDVASAGILTAPFAFLGSTSGKSSPEVNKAVEMLRGKLTREDVNVIGQFAAHIEDNGPRAAMDPELGNTIHSLAKNVFGSEAENWSNQKLKNVFDLVLGKIGQGENTAGLGLQAKPLRSVQEAEAALKNLKPSTKGEIPRGVNLLKTSESVPLAKQIGTEGETVLSEAQAKTQQKVASGQLPPETPTLPDIIQRGAIDVKDKVNLLDYLRTPDRVMKKIGLENESNLIRRKYNDYLEELPTQIDKITQWSKQVSPESNQRIFQFLDGKPIELTPQENNVAGQIKSYLSDWADRLKLPQDKRISNYITHIFDKDLIKKEFDPEMAKLLEDRVSGSVYDPFTEQRLGKLGYKEDTWGALDAYVKRATRKVNMDEALSAVKEKAKSLELSQYKYVKQYVDRINMRPTDVDNLLDNTLKSVVGYKFGVRPTTELTRKSRQAVYRGTLGLNVGSALKNLTQGSNTYARLGEKYTILGYLKNAAKIAAGDDELQRVGVLRDEFIQDRTINATKKFWEKVDKGLFTFFEAAEKINRGSAYFGAKAQALDRGLPEQQAIDYALKTVRDTQFTFGSIDTPPVLASDLAKLLLQFQSFTLKQGEFLGEMVGKKDLAGIVRYSLASALLTTTVGKLIGLKWTDFIPSLRIGLPPTLQAPVEIGKAIMGTPDKFGNVPDTQQRLQNVGKTLIPFVPAGVQINKTVQGLGDVARGFAQNAKGNVKYPVAQTPSNAIRGGLFGPYNLPEAQENKGESPLTEKQSNIYKKNPSMDLYKTFTNKREETKADTQAKEELKSSNKSLLEKNNKVYILQDNGEVRTINPSFQPKKPTLTGNTELDKKLISKYNSQITSKVNDITDLYEAGKMSADAAEKAIKEVKSKEITGGKKMKKPSFRIKKVKVPKLKLSKIKNIKVSNNKKSKSYTLKLKKIIRTKITKNARLT